PTLASLSLKLPGGVELTALQQQVEQQNQQFKGDLGAQGARMKRELRDLQRSIEALQKQVGTPAGVPPAAGAPPPTAVEAATLPDNKEGVVLIFYAQARKELADKIEDALLSKGYAANAIYTDFTEVPAANRGAGGTATLLFTQPKQALAEQLKKELQAKFP